MIFLVFLFCGFAGTLTVSVQGSWRDAMAECSQPWERLQSRY